jgi:hypothetical protein
MRTLSAVVLLAALAVAGCDSKGGSALLGGVAGAAAGAGTYEYRLNQARSQVEEDFKAGRIDQRERDIRIDQINRIALIK